MIEESTGKPLVFTVQICAFLVEFLWDSSRPRTCLADVGQGMVCWSFNVIHYPLVHGGSGSEPRVSIVFRLKLGAKELEILIFPTTLYETVWHWHYVMVIQPNIYDINAWLYDNMTIFINGIYPMVKFRWCVFVFLFHSWSCCSLVAPSGRGWWWRQWEARRVGGSGLGAEFQI